VGEELHKQLEGLEHHFGESFGERLNEAQEMFHGQREEMEIRLKEVHQFLEEQAGALAERVEVLMEEKEEREPERNVELTVDLIVAGDEQQPGGEIPARLAPVIGELQETYAFGQWRLLDTSMIRCRNNGAAEMTGFLSFKPDGASGKYKIRIDNVAVEEAHRAVRINKMAIGVVVPILNVLNSRGDRQFRNEEISLMVEVDLKADQCAVVGKVSLSGASKALFVTVSARILD
jgi:hypothetical protein